MKRSYQYIVFIIVLLFQQSLFAASQFDEADKILTKFYQNTKVPGLSVSIGHKGKIVWSKGYGFADVEQQVKIDPANTKMRIGSVAKTLTTFALARLIEEGKVDLQADVRKYVPEFPKKEHTFTVAQLAGHLAGIRHYNSRDENYSKKPYATVMEGLDIFKDDPLLHKPGSKYRYSSYGYNLLSAVIEKAANENFLDYMQKVVFDPLGMEQTYADHLDLIISGRGSYYRYQDGVLQNEREADNSYKWAGGGYISTTDDLVRFGFEHLYPKHIKPETVKLLWTPLKTNDGKATTYGLAWMSRTDDDGDFWIGHTGGSVGGTTQFWLFPKYDLVIATVGNQSGLKYGDVILQLKRQLKKTLK